MNPEDLAELMSLTVARLAEIKATQEIILKAQAQFLGAVSKSDWKPFYEDLRSQAREATEVYHQQILNEIAQLRLNQKSRRDSGGSTEGA